jgi:Exopolysaccharide synthesis, ExoD
MTFPAGVEDGTVGGSAPVAGELPSGAELKHKQTSGLLEEIVSQAPDGPVDLDWLLGHLDRRSFGLLLLLLGLLVMIPGVATVATFGDPLSRGRDDARP